jgi:hypothetical protein
MDGEVVAKTLCIIPTKDRLESINMIVQSLVYQTEHPDVFIADMCSDKTLLKNNWNLSCAIQHYEQHIGGRIVIQRVEGVNQLAGYQAGLEYANWSGYDLCVGTDDDITFEKDWFEQGNAFMRSDTKEEVGVLVGMTFLPHKPLSEQTCPTHLLTHPEYQGTLDVCHYAHCMFLPPWKERREYEQVFGPFYFRSRQAKSVGGFPTYLSPLGFRGEMVMQSALFFQGRKLVHDPQMVCWHYSNPRGGLRDLPPPGKDAFLKQDLEVWGKFLARGTASTLRP